MQPTVWLNRDICLTLASWRPLFLHINLRISKHRKHRRHSDCLLPNSLHRKQLHSSSSPLPPHCPFIPLRRMKHSLLCICLHFPIPSQKQRTRG